MSALCCSVTLHDWVAWQSCVLEQEEEDNPRRTLSNAPRREPYPYIQQSPLGQLPCPGSQLHLTPLVSRRGCYHA